MRKDHLILLVFLALIAISGGAIYVFRSPDTAVSQNAAPGAMDPRRELKARIVRLEGQLASDPNNLDIIIELGNAHYDVEEPAKSVEYYEKALTIKPDNPPVLVDCGAMYRELGKPDKAIELFKRAITVDPLFPQAYFNLGAVLRMEKGDRVGAAEAWEKYLELESNIDPQIKSLLESEIKGASGS